MKNNLYFAYGSNLDVRQMLERCPSTRFKCLALLPNYHVAFMRKSKCRNCGVADIIPDQKHSVYGVVYEITEQEDWDCLDCNEGYKENRARNENAYNRIEINVIVPEKNDESLTVNTYKANEEPGTHRPSAEYKKQIVQGAIFWNFPADYIKELEEISVQ